MLHSLLSSYLYRVEESVEALKSVHVERYVEEVLTPQRVNLRIRIRFEQGSLLAINEAVTVENDRLIWLDYRYHYQDAENSLIFRYDSTPHFPDLPTRPHHKHLPHDVVASQKPDLVLVIAEAKNAT